MTDIAQLERIALWAVWGGVGLASVLAALVVIGRLARAADDARLRELKRRYSPLIDLALSGDAAAIATLARTSPRDRLAFGRLLIIPLITDRRPDRIVATRAIVRAMALIPLADQWLRSRWAWRRISALQAFGLIQYRERAPDIVAALDDDNVVVRNTALDALADLQDLSTLPAIVARLHDTSLHRGRRAAALTAFGPRCEGYLLELSRTDPENRADYARSLGVCGTGRSRPMLREWITDPRPKVGAAALEALSTLGLDEETAPAVITALDDADADVRQMAARALRGWNGGGDAALHLARHLDDAWPVASRAAYALRSMGAAGRSALEAHAQRTDLAGVLARQMLWEDQWV